MIRKLRKKFILVALLSVFLVLLVLIGSINILNYRNLITEADNTLQILVENEGSFPMQMRIFQEESFFIQGSSGEEGSGFTQSRTFRRARGGFGELAFQSRYFVVWFDSSGEACRMNMENIISVRDSSAVALAEKIYASGREKGFAEEFRFCRADCDGETMLVFLSCERELDTARTFLAGSAGISVIGILAVLVLIVLFSGRVVRPIAESYEKQKRFITDAGHELKTPITIINADVDVLEAESEETENEWLTDIRRQTQRLTGLTADLVYLSRMEEEGSQLLMEDFSLSELVEETVLSFQSLALSQGKDFTSSVQPELHVTGDEKALAKLVSILLDNAMKYSPSGGSVDLTLERAGKSARLTVTNTAEDMEKGNQDRLFERFYRADSSRSSETGGFGLGLAVAKAVVEAHKGSLHAESADGKSLTIKAEIPMHS